MRYIDSKFKEAKPKHTVARIKRILDNLGIDVYEKWHDSGLKNCYSLSLTGKGGVPSSNGKGVTKDFARASAYGEFIERLQGGLFFYKYQSLGRIPEMKLQAFAPDAKYMTSAELEESGDWMDYLINTYKYPSVNRKTIVKFCKSFACADDDKILTLPFYSLFEKKYVHLPIDFVDQIYGTNGCCVGNTREEAWVHALSEIMERHANLEIFTSGAAAPKFSDEIIAKYPIAANIIKQIRESGDFDVELLDYSLGTGFPVVATRIIDKKKHTYSVKVAADPIFEIALQRTLTELFQGRNIKDFATMHDGSILKNISDFPLISNVINQLETGHGRYTADYFADEITCKKVAENFTDDTNRSNPQLLSALLDIFQKEKKQVYVRNFSYLGFPCYRFVVPGFSEALSVKLCEVIPEFSFADSVCNTFRNPTSANEEELDLMMIYSDMIKGTIGRYNYFGRISGVPLSGRINTFLANTTRGYAAFKLGQYDKSIIHLKNALNYTKDDSTKEYVQCIIKYIELKKLEIDDNKIFSIINKFFVKSVAERLFSSFENDKTPFDELLLHCDFESCSVCGYKSNCCYQNSKKITKTISAIYANYTEGQAISEFTLE